uniref:LSM6 homolog, U6 small nuclear RNA and mRNA degradation associated n=1 Tax=Monodelphis domestica TaxID=13616 RepID=A0A5F8GBB9_MONDO
TTPGCYWPRPLKHLPRPSQLHLSYSSPEGVGRNHILLRESGRFQSAAFLSLRGDRSRGEPRLVGRDALGRTGICLGGGARALGGRWRRDRGLGWPKDIRGVLACLDGYMNIALEQTEEYVNGQLKNKYGDAFIRGNNGNVLFFTTTVLLKLFFIIAFSISVCFKS